MRGYPEHLHEVINEDLQESIYDETRKKSNYKTAVNMLIETLEYHIQGYESEYFDSEEEIEKAIRAIKSRIKIVRMFED